MASIKVRKYNHSVYVIYSHGNKKFKLFTGVKVEDQYWVNNSLKKHCPDYDILKRQIDFVHEPGTQCFQFSAAKRSGSNAGAGKE